MAVKNVSINEPFFSGHWPGQPIMPGVLILESVAQAAGILIGASIDNPHSKARADRLDRSGQAAPAESFRATSFDSRSSSQRIKTQFGVRQRARPVSANLWPPRPSFDLSSSTPIASPRRSAATAGHESRVPAKLRL